MSKVLPQSVTQGAQPLDPLEQLRRKREIEVDAGVPELPAGAVPDPFGGGPGVPPVSAAPAMPDPFAGEQPTSGLQTPEYATHQGPQVNVHNTMSEDAEAVRVAEQAEHDQLMANVDSFANEEFKYDPNLTDMYGNPVPEAEQRARWDEESVNQYRKSTNLSGYDQKTVAELMEAYPFNKGQMGAIGNTIGHSAMVFSSLKFGQDPNTEKALNRASSNGITNPTEYMMTHLGANVTEIVNTNAASFAQIYAALAAEKRLASQNLEEETKADEGKSALEGLMERMGSGSATGATKGAAELATIAGNEALANETEGMPYEDYVRLKGQLVRKRLEAARVNRGESPERLEGDVTDNIVSNLLAAADADAGWIQIVDTPDGTPYVFMTIAGKNAIAPFMKMAEETNPDLKGFSQLASGQTGAYINRRADTRRGERLSRNNAKKPEAIETYYHDQRNVVKFVGADKLSFDLGMNRMYLDYRQKQIEAAVAVGAPVDLTAPLQGDATLLPQLVPMIQSGLGYNDQPFAPIDPNKELPEGSRVVEVYFAGSQEPKYLEMKSDGRFRLGTHAHQTQQEMADANSANDGRGRKSPGFFDPIALRSYDDTSDMNGQRNLTQRSYNQGAFRRIEFKETSLSKLPWNAMDAGARIISPSAVQSFMNWLNNQNSTPSPEIRGTAELLAFGYNVIRNSRGMTPEQVAETLTKGDIEKYARLNDMRMKMFPQNPDGSVNGEEVYGMVKSDLPAYLSRGDKKQAQKGREYDTGATAGHWAEMLGNITDEEKPLFLEMMNEVTGDKKRRGIMQESMDFAQQFLNVMNGKSAVIRTAQRVDPDMKSAGRMFKAAQTGDKEVMKRVGFLFDQDASEGMFPFGSPREFFTSSSIKLLDEGFPGFQMENLSEPNKQEMMAKMANAIRWMWREADKTQFEDMFAKLDQMVTDYGQAVSARDLTTEKFIKWMKKNRPKSDSTYTFFQIMENQLGNQFQMSMPEFQEMIARLKEATLRETSNPWQSASIKNAQKLANLLNVVVTPKGVLGEDQSLYQLSQVALQDADGLPFKLRIVGKGGSTAFPLMTTGIDTGRKASPKKTGEKDEFGKNKVYQGGWGSAAENAIGPSQGHYAESMALIRAHAITKVKTAGLFDQSYFENVFDNIVGDPLYTFAMSHNLQEEAIWEVIDHNDVKSYYKAWNDVVNKEINKLLQREKITTGTDGVLPGIQTTIDEDYNFLSSERANLEGKSKETKFGLNMAKNNLKKLYRNGVWAPSHRQITEYWDNVNIEKARKKAEVEGISIDQAQRQLVEQGALKREDYLLFDGMKMEARDTRDNRLQELTKEQFALFIENYHKRAAEDLAKWEAIFSLESEGSRKDVLREARKGRKAFFWPGRESK